MVPGVLAEVVEEDVEEEPAVVSFRGHFLEYLMLIMILRRQLVRISYYFVHSTLVVLVSWLY